ncbi:MAG: GAF domain-containing protein [Chloroflexi bacterium]|jgi:two-component system, OmpR family, phosphate regulon sensor histidine kinase PhoR|nr:GAF domain-containing protein [Chloroflexota bacterium]
MDTTILLIVANSQTGELLDRGVLAPAGFRVTQVGDAAAAAVMMRSSSIDVAILESAVGGVQLAIDLAETYPALPLILIASTEEQAHMLDALRAGVFDFLTPPLKPDAILAAVQRALKKRQRIITWAKESNRRNTDILRQRVSLLETLGKVGRSVTALLDLDEVLKVVVDAAVELTGAEESSLLMLDETTGELYMRAARNVHDDLVNTFRVPVSDTLAGEVMRTGKPILLDQESPQKIKTSYLVKTLIYAPLEVQERIIGVLGVANREQQKSFHQRHVALVSALADYASIAIENARLFENTEIERKKLESILTRIEDGVIVIDANEQVILANPMARAMFKHSKPAALPCALEECFTHDQLLALIRDGHDTFPYRVELELDDERVVNAQLNLIPEIGMTITLHDITYFKELDRIKSDFVSTVSHDLRSPLTAILGYVELLERVGPINERQRNFIQRVQTSVRNITELINDLLDLGRIEAGFNERKVSLSIKNLLQYSVENLRSPLEEKNLTLRQEVASHLPNIFGDSVRLRQVIDNLLGNAIRYSSEDGEIIVVAKEENDQIIFRVEDSGCGIPAADRPHIFEKFYRASNVVENVSGSGLGLAIVKSIVENHQGRVWVDSVEGEGSAFTVVLPIEKGTN